MTIPKVFPLLGGCNLFPTSSSSLPCTRYNVTMGFVQGQSSCTTSFPPLHNYRSLVPKPSNLKSWHSTNEMTLPSAPTRWKLHSNQLASYMPDDHSATRWSLIKKKSSVCGHFIASRVIARNTLRQYAEWLSSVSFPCWWARCSNFWKNMLCTLCVCSLYGSFLSASWIPPLSIPFQNQSTLSRELPMEKQPAFGHWMPVQLDISTPFLPFQILW